MRWLLLLTLANEPSGLTVWAQRFAKGGPAWELRADGCRPVQVTPRRDGAAIIEGPDWRMEGIFEPALGRARLRGSMQWSGDGGLGLSGTSARSEAMEVGEGTLRLAGRRLFIEKTSCEREKL